MAGRRDLPAEAWLSFFAELKGLAARSLTLSGGEVFMRSDLWRLIDGLVESDILLADKGYDSNAIRTKAVQRKAWAAA